MNFIFALSCMMAVIWWLLCGKCEGDSEFGRAMHRRFHPRPQGPTILRGYSMKNLVGEDGEFLDPSKREHFDDYGHMRFGKREQFDDCGHMRFGRSPK